MKQSKQIIKHVKMIEFKPNQIQKWNKQLQNKQFQQIISKQDWVIYGSNFTVYRFNQFFKDCTKIFCQTLVIKRQQQASLLTSIVYPQFSYLTELKLMDNNLTSIQPIAYMNIPSLTIIALGYNHITSLSPLIKLNSKSLEDISIQNNNLIDPYNFYKYLPKSQISKNKKTFQMFKIQAKSIVQFGINFTQIQVQDLSFLVKLSVQFLVQFKIIHSGRIAQQNVRSCRKRRNNKLMGTHIASYD